LTKEKGNKERVKCNFLLAQNKYGVTAVHMAVESTVAVLEKLWGFAKQLNEDELKNKETL
jgi:hypothetical protein